MIPELLAARHAPRPRKLPPISQADANMLAWIDDAIGRRFA